MENYIGYVENDLVLESHDKVKGTDTEIAVDYKSIQPSRARRMPRFAETVDFPTPPLQEVTIMTLQLPILLPGAKQTVFFTIYLNTVKQYCQYFFGYNR